MLKLSPARLGHKSKVVIKGMGILIKKLWKSLAIPFFFCYIANCLDLFMKGGGLLWPTAPLKDHTLFKYVSCFIFYYVSVYLCNVHGSAHRGHQIIGTEVTSG